MGLPGRRFTGGGVGGMGAFSKGYGGGVLGGGPFQKVGLNGGGPAWDGGVGKAGGGGGFCP